MSFIRSISGLRGTLGKGLLPNILSNHVAAFDRILPKGEIIIGRDGRPSGEWIEQIITGSLLACGRSVRLVGIVPTPTVQLCVEHSEAVAGIVITASHNPEKWNGLKFINKDGVFLNSKENTKLWNAEKFAVFNFADSFVQNNIVYNNDAINMHIGRILDLPIFQREMLKSLKKRRFSVVVDAVNASGSKAVPKLLRKLGCNVIELFCKENGEFPHEPEPLPVNLSLLSKAVIEHNADLGVAVDPDADRLVLINEKGEPIGEEKTIVLAIKSVLENLHLFNHSENEPVVVVNQSTTRMVDDIAKEYGAVLKRSNVGEINVIRTMKKYDAVIGGEGSGGVILPACHFGRDSLVGISLILTLLIQKNSSLKQLSDSLPKYSMIKKKCVFNGNFDDIVNNIIREFPNGKPERGDGIKINFVNSWLQVRSSNTEPVIRMIAEDPDIKEAKRLVRILRKLCDNN